MSNVGVLKRFLFFSPTKPVSDLTISKPVPSVSCPWSFINCSRWMSGGVQFLWGPCFVSPLMMRL